jgi:hypothetical protein
MNKTSRELDKMVEKLSPSLSRWLKNQGCMYEVTKSTEGHTMIFVPYKAGLDLCKWLKRYFRGNYKYDARCNYEWMCFMF